MARNDAPRVLEMRRNPEPGIVGSMNDLAELGPQVDAVVVSLDGAQRAVRLLVDTGADVTMVSEGVLADLRSVPEGMSLVEGVFAGPAEREVHDLTLRLMLTDGDTLVVQAFVTSMPTANDGVDGLVGREILELLRMTYDGPNGVFELLRPAGKRPQGA